MTLRRMVVDLITDRGCGTVDHLMPTLSELGFTRQQAIKALQNAQQRGFLWCEEVKRSGVGRATHKPAIYWPGEKEPGVMYGQLIAKKKEPKPMLVSSVFELGSPRPQAAWPQAKGTVYRPLGGWSLESDVYEERAA